MNIHVLLSPLNVDELYFTNKTTVVIDVLRATSTIVTALANGAKEVVPVGTIEFAMKVSGSAFGGKTLLGGERNTKKIEGFTLGNSPLEYTQEAIESKSVVLFTTNGTKAITKAKFSENLFPVCFNNLPVVAKHVVALGNDIEILCAGANGMFCLDDTVCAGYLIEEIKKLNPDVHYGDAARASVSLFEDFGNDIKKLLSDCEHGRLLIENGFEKDIEYIAEVGKYDIVPYFDSGVLKLAKEENQNENETVNKN